MSALWMLLGFALALGLTILIEWGFSYKFIGDKHDRKLVILAQCLTNPAFNLLLLITSVILRTHNSLLLILFFETLVVITEGLIYKSGFKNKTIKPFLLSFSLNVASLIIGYIVSFMLMIIISSI